MKFDKEFRTYLEQTLPEWRDKFLCYKFLKKLVKQISVTQEGGLVLDDDKSSSDAGLCYPEKEEQDENKPWVSLEERFVMKLDEELDKFNDFYMDKEEEFIIRLQELKERIERVKGKSSRSGILSCESKFSEEMVDIRREFVKIHGEMVLLKNYGSLNFTGLVKIVKKYDKRRGALLRFPFIQRAVDQPFFTAEPLTRLLHECETNLELLFSLEPEVVQSDAPNDTTERSRPQGEAVSSLREAEDTLEMRRSIVAAMRAIEGIRRASSTYNSFQRHYDDDEAGAVTSENSVSKTSAVLQNDENDENVSSSPPS